MHKYMAFGEGKGTGWGGQKRKRGGHSRVTYMSENVTRHPLLSCMLSKKLLTKRISKR